MNKAPEFTPAERDRLEERMWNWARWVLDDPHGPKARCGSAEGRYESTREDQIRFEKSAQEPIDILDAGKVELAVTSIVCPIPRWSPATCRMFVMSWFVYRSHPVAMAKRFRCQEWQLPVTLWTILGAIQYRLDRQPIAVQRKVGYKVSNNLSTPHICEAIGSR